MTSPHPEPTESAVVVLVPAAEPLVAAHRLELDPAAAWGVPAHVTVLYPFVPPDRLDPAVLDRLAAAVATVPAFRCDLRRTARFDTGYLWLAPEPDEPFRALMAAVHPAFPDLLPYGGKHDDPTPHLTVGQDGGGSPETLAAAEDTLRAGLPVGQDVTSVAVLVGAPAPGSWFVHSELPLGAATTRAPAAPPREHQG